MNNFIGINPQIPTIQTISAANSSSLIPTINPNGSHISGIGSKSMSSLNNSSSNKTSNNSNFQHNMMFYQNVNNNFIGYNTSSSIPINPLIYNNSNMNNYSNLCQQYDFNYFGYYPNNGNNSNTQLNVNNSNSSKDLRLNMNQS